jgi:guanosine-3',5'-bis(diphosphate) 3'-pyrophosphohydrolase
VDFAYAIHSAVGNRMVGARVNGKLVNIDYQIQNGDRIEVITSQNSRGPSRDWLNIVKSAQAKTKINQWFKNELKDDNIIRGRDMIDRYCKAKGIDWSEINKPEYQEKVMKRYAFKDWDSVLATIGHGGLKEGQVVNKLVDEHAKDLKKQISDKTVLANLKEGSNSKIVPEVQVKKSGNGIVVKGIHDLAVRFSRCCTPVPGDEIVGFVTRGRGISIHRTDCINIINLPEEERVRLIPAEWQAPEGEIAKYRTEIKIFANNRVGMFVDISKVFTERGIDITSINVRTNKQGLATIMMSFDTAGVEELKSLTEKLKMIDGVIDIERTKG